MPPNIVLLSGNPIYPQEKIASVAILPGHLVEVVPSGGDQGQLRLHALAGGNAMPAFANVSITPDSGVATTALDTPWADGETVRWLIGRPGDMFYALLAPNAAAVVEGDNLESATGGNLRKHTPQVVTEAGTAAAYTIYAQGIVGQAAEAIDNSANGTAVRIRVRIR